MSQLSQLTQEKHVFQAILKKYIFIVKKKKKCILGLLLSSSTSYALYMYDYKLNNYQIT